VQLVDIVRERIKTCRIRNHGIWKLVG